MAHPYGPGYGAPMYAPPPQQPGNGLAIAGMVTGIVGLVLFFIPFFGWLLALLGIVFGIIGMSKANKIGGRGRGLALTGVICGGLGLVAGIGFYIAIVKFVNSTVDHAKSSMTRIHVRRFATEYYPRWQVKTGKQCPATLQEIMPDPDMAEFEMKDTWGRDLEFVCADTAPASAHGFGVFSLGEDGKADTDDDIRSWQ